MDRDFNSIDLAVFDFLELMPFHAGLLPLPCNASRANGLARRTGMATVVNWEKETCLEFFWSRSVPWRVPS